MEIFSREKRKKWFYSRRNNSRRIAYVSKFPLAIKLIHEHLNLPSCVIGILCGSALLWARSKESFARVTRTLNLKYNY